MFTMYFNPNTQEYATYSISAQKPFEEPLRFSVCICARLRVLVCVDKPRAVCINLFFRFELNE